MLIAIDGPSGSGKSSAARGVAKRLGLAYLDTGAMYRAITAAQLAAGIPGQDQDQIVELTRQAVLELSTVPDDQWVRINGTDVTSEIREPRIAAAVSQAATNLEVRAWLTRLMRDEIAGAGRNIVVEGRDITTVVAPDADVRILLVADPAERMRRRAAELGQTLSKEQLADQVLRRDRDDSTVSQFMEATEGVNVVDSTELSLDEVIDLICGLAERNE